MVSGVIGPAMHTSSECVTVCSNPNYRGGFSDSLTFCVVALGLSHSWPIVRARCNLASKALPLVNLDHILKRHTFPLMGDDKVPIAIGDSGPTLSRFSLRENELELLCSLLLVGLEWGAIVRPSTTVHGLSNSHYGVKMPEPVGYANCSAVGRWELTRSYLVILAQSNSDAVIATGFPAW